MYEAAVSSPLHVLYSLFLSATKNKHKQKKQNSECLNNFSFPNLLGTSFCLLTFLGRMVGFFLLPHHVLGTSSCGLIVSGNEKERAWDLTGLPCLLPYLPVLIRADRNSVT